MEIHPKSQVTKFCKQNLFVRGRGQRFHIRRFSICVRPLVTSNAYCYCIQVSFLFGEKKISLHKISEISKKKIETVCHITVSDTNFLCDRFDFTLPSRVLVVLNLPSRVNAFVSKFSLTVIEQRHKTSILPTCCIDRIVDFINAETYAQHLRWNFRKSEFSKDDIYDWQCVDWGLKILPFEVGEIFYAIKIERSQGPVRFLVGNIRNCENLYDQRESSVDLSNVFSKYAFSTRESEPKTLQNPNNQLYPFVLHSDNSLSAHFATSLHFQSFYCS